MQNISAGSFIIRMGITPQTINNGLKPYGLVYDLLKNQQVPVKWVINQSKIKDGIDFSHNGIDYRGSAFIIPFEFRTTAVNTIISNWVAAGVVGSTTVSDITVDVFQTILFVPKWTIDKLNGNLVVPFFTNAGIPSAAYGGSLSSNWKDPSDLNSCDDIFALPHADPTWATHQNLYYWNQNFKGNIWSACHAVSVLENVTNPAATIQMNFLSTTGLVLFGSHVNGTPPFIYQFPTDKVMQFMSTFDGSTTKGSEQIYLPKTGGAWRPGTKLLVYNDTHANVPSISPGPAAVAIYGRAYNDTTRGFVMYQGGHNLNINGTATEIVAAQRAFFNYSFFSTVSKSQIPYIDMTPFPTVVVRGANYSLNYNLPPGFVATNYKTKWTSSCGGTFLANDSIKNPTFRAPTDPTINTCVICVKLTDACGRENFDCRTMYVVNGVLKDGWADFTALRNNNAVNLKWNTISDANLVHFTIERSTDGVTFSSIGSKAAINNTPEKILYEYVDYPEADKDYFYRIKAVDKQQNFALSKTIFVPAKSKTISLKVIPNPVTVSSIVNVYSSKMRNAEISCFDMTGKMINASNIKLNKGETIVDYKEMNQLTAGIYLLKIKADNEVQIVKIIVR